MTIDPINSRASYFGKSTGSNNRSVPINRTVTSNWHQRVMLDINCLYDVLSCLFVSSVCYSEVESNQSKMSLEIVIFVLPKKPKGFFWHFHPWIILLCSLCRNGHSCVKNGPINVKSQRFFDEIALIPVSSTSAAAQRIS